MGQSLVKGSKDSTQAGCIPIDTECVLIMSEFIRAPLAGSCHLEMDFNFNWRADHSEH